MTIAEQRVWLSLGSNIRPRDNLRAALRLLRSACSLERCSPVYRTAPRGDPGQADFLNMAVQVRTVHSPDHFHRDVIQAIETRLMRRRDPRNRNAARTIDVDIALWEDAAFEYGDPPRQIPDPDVLRYPHVALPLAALAPAKRHPLTGETLAAIASRLGDEGVAQVMAGPVAGGDALSP